MKHFLLGIVFVLTAFVNAFSQSFETKFKHWGTREGLSHANVFSIIQDNKGMMWFGTRDGLNKFDGYKFTTYRNDSKNPNSISNNSVRALALDNDNRIWAGSYGGGISIYNPYTNEFSHYKHNPDDPSSLSNNDISYILIDKAGNIWIGTLSGGLNLFDRKNNNFIRFKYNENDPNTLSNNRITSLVEDYDGNIWIGTEGGGLCHLDTKSRKFSSYKSNDKFLTSSNQFIRSLYRDSQNNIWVGTNDAGLNLFDRKTGTFKKYSHRPDDPTSVANNTILSMAEDNKGNLWVGTENGGVSILPKNSEAFFNIKNDPADNYSLSSNSVWSIFKDNKGALWVGTYSGGLNYYDAGGLKFNSISSTFRSDGLNNNNVLRFLEDKRGNLWVATDGGGLNLFHRKTNKFQHFVHNHKDPHSISSNHVLSLLEDSENNFWLGTYGGGLNKFDRDSKKFISYKRDDNDSTSIISNNLWYLKEDSYNNFWIGALWSGLELFDRKTGKFKHYRHNDKVANSLSMNNIIILFEDSRRNFWIGTDGGGLNMYDRANDAFIHYKYDEKVPGSLSNNIVNYITEDSKGNLWVCTNSGLNLFDPSTKKFTIFNENQGLPNASVNGLLEDGKGFIWLSTNKGLSRFDPVKKTFRNYDMTDGLPGNDFNRGACIKTKDGQMFFGGPNGFTYFNPETIRDNEFIPPVIISDFAIFNKTVEIGETSPLKKHITETKNINISYDESVFSFEFVALNYTIPEKNQYAYKLEGFDKEWNYIGTKRTATYTNLDPGKYIFKVKGSNNDGYWNEEGTFINIAISPPYWATWPFRIMILLVIISLLLGIYKLRVSLIESQKKQLAKQVKERTAEISMQKEELVKQAESLKAANQEIEHQREKLEFLYSETKANIRSARAIQQSILPSKDLIKKHLPEAFVLSKPQAVISGDFYWFDVIDDKIIIAAIDCTGHGVSGAFMSINGYHLLNQSIYSHEDLVASEILDRLHEAVIKELNHNNQNHEVMDGMDIALCIIDKKNNKLQYSGANSPLYIVRRNSIIEGKPGRLSIGTQIEDRVQKYFHEDFDLEENDVIYMFSDGFADQIGKDDKKYLYSRFREFLLNIQGEQLETQEILLHNELEEWKGSRDQLDDILVIGFKVF